VQLSPVPSLWQRLAGVRPEEAPAVLWSMLYVS
jgi:AAA family ATP:ADP antiporter